MSADNKLTQILAARRGITSPEVEAVARKEQLDAEWLAGEIAAGRVVMVRNNRRRDIAPLAIGNRLPVRVNANIGTSRDACNYDAELRKARAALEAGADAIMDLSTGGDLDHMRRLLMSEVKLPMGTVPIYEAVARAVEEQRSFCELEAEEIFTVIANQLEQGVDFLTVHCGVSLRTLERMEREGRVLDVVSRGGSMTIAWMRHNERENPLLKQFDRLLDLAATYDAVLSLGDGFRPGATRDATDRAQIAELLILGELQQRALERGVQVMIEGPGHVPMDQIQANVLLEKRLCHGAPFYVLGPLVSDRAPGYDHITGAIGGALAAWAGADFLCYVTPAEHLRLPDEQDVRQGVVASRIAAAAAELANQRPQALAAELAMSQARKQLDWEGMFQHALDPQTARRNHEQLPPGDADTCSMCGELCAIKLLAK